MAQIIMTLEAGQVLANKIKTNQSSITTVQAAISTLNGTGAGSVEKTVTDKIAEVVASAPADFDTLKEISDWISDHADDASAMNSAIQANTTALGGHTLGKDVPSDAVFTDTVYDDTSLAGRVTANEAAIANIQQNAYDDTALSNRVSVVEGLLDSHSVQTNVPANAVFTDTVYDDTALAGRVTSLESAYQLVTAAEAEAWFS